MSNNRIQASETAQEIADNWINGNRKDAIAKMMLLTNSRMLATVSIMAHDMIRIESGEGDAETFLLYFLVDF